MQYTSTNTPHEFRRVYSGEHVEFEDIECFDTGVQAKHVRAPAKCKLMHACKFQCNQMQQKRIVQFNNRFTQP